MVCMYHKSYGLHLRNIWRLQMTESNMSIMRKIHTESWYDEFYENLTEERREQIKHEIRNKLMISAPMRKSRLKYLLRHL